MEVGPLKILYVLSEPMWRFVSKGTGHGTHVQGVVNALTGAGHDVEFLDARRGSRAAAADNRSRREPGPRPGGRAVQDLLPARARAVARDLTYLSHNRRVGRLVAARLGRADIDLVYERFNHMQSATVRAARSHGVPIIVEFNAGQHEIVEFLEPGLVGLGQRIEQRVLGRADRVITVSEVLRRRLVDLGIPDAQVVAQHNGVDVERFRPDIDGGGVRRRLGFADGHILVGFIGSLSEWHGVDLLIDAAREVRTRAPMVRFLLVGGEAGTPRFESVRSRVAGAGLETAVHMVGQVPHEEVPAYIAAVDVATVPWAADYGSPLKIFEYMAMGKAIVAADQPAVREVLTDGENAVLTPHDPQLLAAALVGLAADGERRRRLGAAARQAAVERHTWRHHAELIEQLYADISAGRRC